ncbi:MAG: hypothetical protein ABI579_09105 [Candidatus Sumerlaeota bacterium]
MSAPILAAFAAFCAIALLDFTEAFDPGGSSLGWLTMGALIAAHVPLLREALTRGSTRLSAGESPRIPRWIAASLSIAIVIVTMTSVVRRAHEDIFSKAVIPAESAQLGLVAQIAARMETSDLLYGNTYRQGASSTLNAFPIGGVVPFALARKLGWDSRYASLAAAILCAGFILAGVVHILRVHGPGKSDGLPIAMALAGVGWICLRRSVDYFNWGHTVVLWPLIALLGLAMSTRKTLIVAIVAGLLAAMNAGWLLLLPVVACFLFAEDRRKFPLLLLVLCAFPAVVYTLFLDERNAFLPGVFGSLFEEGWKLERGASWRFASIHAFTDILHLRPVVYAMALCALVLLCIRIIKSQNPRQRVMLFTLAVFTVVACGPTTYFFHWISYAILIGSVLPAFVSATASSISPRWRVMELFSGAALASLLFAAVAMRLNSGISDTIDKLPKSMQGVDRNLLSGFNVRSEDHAWGKSPHMAVGFTMDRRQAGTLELHLGTIGGDFTPINNTMIRVNGHDKGVFRVLPGEYRYARIPLSKDDVVIGFNVVELNAAWARTPRSLGISADDRTVSISYLGMRFLPWTNEVQLAARE